MTRTVMIGGETLDIPFPISFADLEAAWPGWEHCAAAGNQIEFASACLEFLAPVLKMGNLAALKAKLMPSEMEGLGEAVLGVLRDNKVIPAEDAAPADAPSGEAQPVTTPPG